MTSLDDIDQDAASRMRTRRSACVDAMHADFRSREDALPTVVATENASAKSKLQRVYRLLDEFGEIRAPHVACKAGCADCCRMNVQISALEAEHIALATGRKAVKLTTQVAHSLQEFNGQACPFLIDNMCSIYDARPSACRLHASFDTDAYWCEPSRSTRVAVPTLRLDGAIEAWQILAAAARAPVADIRDFFPVEKT